MVTVVDFSKMHNAEGKEFNSLTVMGGVEFVQSQKSGSFYATAWKASIACTFNDEMCKSLIGKNLPGDIEKVEVEPYEYHIPETGETIYLTHKYSYNPAPGSKQPSMEKAVFGPEPIHQDA